MIREHGDAIEADLAFRGIDMRDLWRRGSGLTLRRLMVLIRALPPEAALWAAMREAEKKASKPTVEQIRERQEFYAKRAQEAEEAQ